jgi:Leucine-rich repeat (LRR) protein
MNGSLKFIPNLQKINLIDNKIEVIDKDFFEGSTQLTTIFLSANRIKTIDERAFTHLKELMFLMLTKNKIVEFPAVNAKDIDLTFNEIVRIKLKKLKRSMSPTIKWKFLSVLRK